LKLGRTNSNRGQAPTFNKRTSSLAASNAKENENPNTSSSVSMKENEARPQDADMDTLVLELVQAKTAEAVAKQEAEEAKGKLESLRKMLGMGAGDSPTGVTGNKFGNGSGHRASPSMPVVGMGIERSNTVGIGGFGKGNGNVGKGAEIQTPVSATPSSAVSGGFWGGWGKRVASTGGEKIGLGSS